VLGLKADAPFTPSWRGRFTSGYYPRLNIDAGRLNIDAGRNPVV
jgi:hypothetical protein